MKRLLIFVPFLFLLAGCSRLEVIDGNCVELSDDYHDNFSKIQELSKYLGFKAPLNAVGNIAANGEMLLIVHGKNRSISCLRQNQDKKLEFLLKDGSDEIIQDWVTHEQHKLLTWGE